MSEHIIRRINDQFHCTRCHKQWDIDDDDPPPCLAGLETCATTGKIIHTSIPDALRSMSSLPSHKTKRKLGQMSAYKCPHCNGFHYGHGAPKHHINQRDKGYK